MSRRLNPCRRCGPDSTGRGRFSLKRGLTRHDDRLCAACRRGEPTDAEAEATAAAYKGRAA